MSLLPLLLGAAFAQSVSGVDLSHAANPFDILTSPVATPTFSWTPVSGCGCSVNAVTGNTTDAPSKSEDGSDVTTGEGAVGAFHYAWIVVKFSAPQPDLDAADGVLGAYLEFLKGNFNIVSSQGATHGQTLGGLPSARGIADAWTDKDGDTWAVQGWATLDRLAVLMVYGRGTPPSDALATYHQGFRVD